MQPLDPYAPPQAESLKPLGSLAQAARDKQIRQARSTFIVIGVLTLGLNGFLLYNLPNEIAQAARSNNVGPAQEAQFRQAVSFVGYAIYGGATLLGLVFVALGLLIKLRPVPITIIGLVLYIGSAVGFGLLNPLSLAQGVIVKVIIVVALVRAIKAARAYEQESKLAPGALPG